MNRLKTSLALMTFVFSLPLVGFADTDNTVSQFAGNWSGRGTYVLSGDMTNCPTFKLLFVAGPNRFQFASGQRDCDKHTESFPPVTLTAKDGNMLFNGQEVGSYTNEVMQLKFSMPEGNGKTRHWRMSMRVSGEHLMYEESRTMDNEATPLISFASVLIRQ